MNPLNPSSTATLSPETLLSHADFVRGLARSLVRDAHTADDLAQDALVRALERPPRSRASLRSWLSSVTRNFARQRHRSAARREVHEQAAGAGEPSPSASEVLEREALRSEVVQAVLGLPELQRQAVLLRYYEGCTPGEIARRLDAKPETVRTQIKRGRARLRAELERRHGREEWLGALAPLAAHPSGPIAPPVGSLASPVLSSGGVKLVAAALTIAVAAGTWWSLRPAAAPPPGAPTIASPVVPIVAPDEEGDREGPLPERSVRTPARVASPPVAEPAGSADGASLASAVLAAATPQPASPEPARLEVRARIVDTGEPVVGFRASLHGLQSRSYHSASTPGDVLELSFELDEDLGYEDFDLSVAHGSLGQAGERVRLFSGRTVQVELHFRTGRIVTGLVVDELSRPVADALVFLGIQEHLRGDEPFKPYEPRRVRNGVRTDESGHFELAGRGPRVTVWHGELSPTTVPVEEANRIVLGRRAALTGVVVDGAGEPIVALDVALDRARQTRTDALGEFRFDALEAGVRGLQLGDGRMLAVELAPGELVDVRIEPGLAHGSLELVQGGAPVPVDDEEVAILIGTSQLASLRIARAEHGRLALEQLLPDTYYVLTSSGCMGLTEVRGDRARLELGLCSLTIHAEPGRSLFVAPARANELVWLMANRIAARRVPESGSLVFRHLPEGEYVVGSEGHGELARVWVSGAGSSTTLD